MDMPRLKPSKGLPAGVSFWHPATLISTWFGVGLLPLVPGTWGSLAALPIAWLVAARFGPYAVAAVGLLLFAVGVWAASVHTRHTRAKDPGEIVVDEVAAQMIACAPAGTDPIAFALAFVTFRIFDAMKPWPLRALENRLPGGLGVMADDFGAGLYAAATVILYFLVLGRPHAFL